MRVVAITISLAEGRFRVESNRFDTLTRQVASSATRRQVLKGLFTFAVGTLLSQIGLGTRVYAESDPNQASAPSLFMPFTPKACEEASRNGHNIDCGYGCRCIETSEGAIRCGTPPKCDAPKCQTSADCAHLGDDYFCDTPNSGSCSDSELTRCIAPCTNSCPEAQRCGERCCAPNQICTGDKCVSGYDCDTTYYAKLEDIKAAHKALDNGALTADISPQGCIRLRQDIVDDKVVARYLIFGTNEVSVSRWGENEYREELDGDNDGFKEWLSVTTYGPNTGDFKTVESEFDPETRALVGRTTTTPNGDQIQVVVEEIDASGKAKVVLQYDTPRVQDTTLGEAFLQSASSTSQIMADPPPCEAKPCDPAKIKQRLSDGIDRASNCLPDKGPRALALYENSYAIQERKMDIQCKPISGVPQATIEGWENPTGKLTVTVDPAKYCELNEEERGWILYHEVLHATLRTGHNPRIERLPEEHRKQLDRVYGCMAMCYNNKGHETRCMCAQCFGTVPCDPICHSFNSDCGATCPCKTQNNKYFTSCQGCLADCPSGLACAGIAYCDPVGQSPKCPPVTCPG